MDKILGTLPLQEEKAHNGRWNSLNMTKGLLHSNVIHLQEMRIYVMLFSSGSVHLICPGNYWWTLILALNVYTDSHRLTTTVGSDN